MKKIGYLLALFSLSLCLQIIPAYCIPIDLTGFTGDATVSGGTVTLSDDFTQNWYAFYNPSYDVAADAGTLSFDYTLDLVPDTTFDYLTMEINLSPVITVTADGSGTLSFDLIPYQDQTIDLAWVLYWGGGLDADGSSASISNIDLAAAGAAPIPEPATIVLIGMGLCSLPFIRRKIVR
jgi:hypothetical protein